MTPETCMRTQLKRALFELEVARNKRRAGSAVRVLHADMQRLETHVTKSSDVFDRLMQKLIAQKSAECMVAPGRAAQTGV
jgi:hypothetical protein